MSLYGVDTVVTSEFAGDEWEHLFWARIKSIVANTRQIAQPPWVEWLVPEGSMHDLPQAMKLPDELLQGLVALNETVVELMEGKRYDMGEMTKLMKKHAGELSDTHSSFRLDLQFLQTKAHDALKTKVCQYACNAHASLRPRAMLMQRSSFPSALSSSSPALVITTLTVTLVIITISITIITIVRITMASIIVVIAVASIYHQHRHRWSSSPPPASSSAS